MQNIHIQYHHIATVCYSYAIDGLYRIFSIKRRPHLNARSKPLLFK